ncbi:MAG: amidophosphoribosyltransferase [Armatimonadota bacterium]
MSDELRHECGITALYLLDEPYHEGCTDAACQCDDIISDQNVASLIPRILLDLQTRGQLAAGLTSFQGDRAQLLKTYKDVGTVQEVFRTSMPARLQEILDEYAGSAAIGHTRYATCGLDDVRYAQPFERVHGRLWKWFSFAFNGNLANYRDIRDELVQKQYHFTLNSDSEIILHALTHSLRPDRPTSLKHVMSTASRIFDGAYNLVFLDAMQRMFVARDPLGFRPLSWAVQGRLFAAASESMALMNLGFADIHSLQPGEMAILEDGKLRFTRFAANGRQARCFFEWIYFASLASVIDDIPVNDVRIRLGKQLADLEDQSLDGDCIVVAVPDTARTTAGAYAHRLGLPYVEGIIRNRYVGRTFIQPENIRGVCAQRKYTLIPSVLKGKRVFLVEDSIVRSTTLLTLIRQLRQIGVREVHIRVSCPPIVSPCFYGIDMSTRGELFAPSFTPDGYASIPDPAMLGEMARALGVDSLRYLGVPDIAASLQTGTDTLCTGCVTGCYPTPCGQRLADETLREPVGVGGRSYE